MNQDEFSLYLLGVPRVSVGQCTITSLSLKAQWLLAMLVLAPGNRISRDTAADLLWPDTRSADPRGLLRSLLSELRVTLGAAAYRLSMGSHKTISLDLTGAFVDVFAFDRDIAQGDLVSLRRAVALYRSELLSGCQEEWIVMERQCRADAYMEAIRRLNARAKSSCCAGDVIEVRPHDPVTARMLSGTDSDSSAQLIGAAILRRRIRLIQAQMGELVTQIAEMERQFDSLFAQALPSRDPADADVLYQRGVEALTRGELDSAREYLLQALALIQEAVKDSLREANIADQLGTLAMWYGNREEACAYIERSFDLRAAKQDQKGLVSSLLRLGDVAESLMIAQEYYARALQVAEVNDNAEGIAWSHWSLADAPLFREEWQPVLLSDTLFHIRQAIQNFAQLHDSVGLVTCMDGVVRLLFALDKAEEARGVLRAADSIRAVYSVARLQNEQEAFDKKFAQVDLSDLSEEGAQGRQAANTLSGTSLREAAAFMMEWLEQIEAGIALCNRA